MKKSVNKNLQYKYVLNILATAFIAVFSIFCAFCTVTVVMSTETTVNTDIARFLSFIQSSEGVLYAIVLPTAFLAVFVIFASIFIIRGTQTKRRCAKAVKQAANPYESSFYEPLEYDGETLE